MPPDPARALATLGDAAYDAAAALPGAGDTFDSEDARAAGRRASRDPRNFRSLSFWTSVAAYRALHHLAVDEDKTAERLLNEGLNLVFASRGLPQLAAKDGTAATGSAGGDAAGEPAMAEHEESSNSVADD
jgi:hypothetical protein